MKIVKVSYNDKKITKKKLFCRCDHPYPGTYIRTFRGYVKFPKYFVKCPKCTYYMWFYTQKNLEDKKNHDFIIIEEVSV